MTPEEYAEYIGPFDSYDPTEKQVDWWSSPSKRFDTMGIDIDIAKCENCERIFPVFVKGEAPVCSCGCTRFTYEQDTIVVDVVIDRETGCCYIDDGDNLC